MARMTYRIQDRHGTYDFRRIVPKALRPFMPTPWTGKSAWTKSLGTKEQVKGKQAFARCLSDCEVDFAPADPAYAWPAHRGATKLPSDAEIDAEVLAGLLAADELERLEPDPRQRFQTPEERAQWPDLVKLKHRGIAEDYHYVLGGELEAQHAANRFWTLEPALRHPYGRASRRTAKDRRAGPWSKWFNRYLRNKAGIEDPVKVFHSFRHTFKRMARDAGIQEEMHDFMTGHAGGGGVVRGFGSGFGLKAMAAEMAKIEAPEAVRGLRREAMRSGR